jgi:metal-responsive CopG/Arc/MetJ family transcriptional regulator
MVRKPLAPEPGRVAIPMDSKLIDRIDEYRWRARVPSRAAAIRALLEIGLQHVEPHGRAPRSSKPSDA